VLFQARILHALAPASIQKENSYVGQAGLMLCLSVWFIFT